MIRLGILETGRPPEELGKTYGDYPEMMKNWLALPESEVLRFAVLDGEIPAAADVADLWVITGSRHGVYEDHPWIAPFENFIRSCRDASVPMIGICFGHQIIAQALGGRVEKSGKGWGLGVHQYDIIPANKSLEQLGDTLSLQAVHQDQVVDVPQGAERLARSQFCENAALLYPGFALTFQGHPEFGPAFVRDLLTLRRGTAFPEEIVDQILDNADPETNADALAGAIRDWLGETSGSAA